MCLGGGIDCVTTAIIIIIIIIIIIDLVHTLFPRQIILWVAVLESSYAFSSLRMAVKFFPSGGSKSRRSHLYNNNVYTNVS
jgi:hypothetical protein